jgi:hypothetical protein
MKPASVQALRRRRFLEQVNAAYASLRRHSAQWRAIERERREWDVTLLDHLTVTEAASQDERDGCLGAGLRDHSSSALPSYPFRAGFARRHLGLSGLRVPQWEAFDFTSSSVTRKSRSQTSASMSS